MKELYNITKDLYDHIFVKNTFKRLSKADRLILLQTYLLKAYNLNKESNYIRIDKDFPLKDMKDTK